MGFIKSEILEFFKLLDPSFKEDLYEFNYPYSNFENNLWNYFMKFGVIMLSNYEMLLLKYFISLV